MDEKIFESILQNILFKARNGEDVLSKIEEYKMWCIASSRMGVDTSKEIRILDDVEKELQLSGYSDKFKNLLINYIFNGGENDG